MRESGSSRQGKARVGSWDRVRICRVISDAYHLAKFRRGFVLEVLREVRTAERSVDTSCILRLQGKNILVRAGGISRTTLCDSVRLKRLPATFRVADSSITASLGWCSTEQFAMYRHLTELCVLRVIALCFRVSDLPPEFSPPLLQISVLNRARTSKRPPKHTC